MVDGFYALYFTGRAGVGFALIVLKNGIVAGADIAGGFYDGEYSVNVEKQLLEGTMKLTTPPGVSLVTGTPASSTPQTQQFPFSLPAELNEEQVALVQTSTGPVNVKFKKIRDLPND